MSSHCVWSKLACFNRATTVGGEKDDGEWMEPIVRRSREKSSRGGGAGETGGSRRRVGARNVVAGKEPRKAARRRSTVEDDESEDESAHREERVDAADGQDASRDDLPFGLRLAMMIIRFVFSKDAVLRTAREITGESDFVGNSRYDDDDNDDDGSADIVISLVKRDDGGAGDSEPCDAEKVDDAISEVSSPWPWSGAEVDDTAREATGSNAINSEWSNIIDSEDEDEPDEAHDEAPRLSAAAQCNPGEGGMRRVTSSNSIDRKYNKPDAGERGTRGVTSSPAIDRTSELDGIPEFSGAARDKTTNSKLVKPRKTKAKKGGRARRATESPFVPDAGDGGMRRVTSSNAIHPKGELDNISELSSSLIVHSKDKPELLSLFSDSALC